MTLIRMALCYSLVILLVVVVTGPVQASPEELTVVFTDSVGDSDGPIDVVGMLLSFDNATGGYTIGLLADSAGPFHGDFRVNVNLYDPDTGTTACFPSFFNDTFNDFWDYPSNNSLTLTGINMFLTAWEEGDRVATTSAPFGNPDCASLFRSAVSLLADPWARDFIADGHVFGTIEAVIIFSNGFESGDTSAWSTALCPGCPVADFSFAVNFTTVSFFNSSTGAQPLAYSWNFDDGSAPSALESPVHVYGSYGTYDVALRATNSLGSDSVVKSVVISP